MWWRYRPGGEEVWPSGPTAAQTRVGLHLAMRTTGWAQSFRYAGQSSKRLLFLSPVPAPKEDLLDQLFLRGKKGKGV